MGLIITALPSSAAVERSVTVRATPASVFPLLNSPRGFDSFNPFRDEDPGLKTIMSGPAFGPGAVYGWQGKQGAGQQIIIRSDPDREVEMALDLGAMGRHRQIFVLTPAGEGTHVTWRLQADFAGNPIGKIFALFLDQLLGQTYVRGLNKLKALSEARA